MFVFQPATRKRKVSEEYISPDLSDIDTETGEIILDRKKKRLADIGRKVPARSAKGSAERARLAIKDNQGFYDEKGVFPGDDEAPEFSHIMQLNVAKGLRTMQDIYSCQQEQQILLSTFSS